jgi:hypothetical protein
VYQLGELGVDSGLERDHRAADERQQQVEGDCHAAAFAGE